MARHPCLLIWGVWPFHYTGAVSWFWVSGHSVTPGLSPGSGCLAIPLHRGCLQVLGVWPLHYTGAVSWFWVSGHSVTPVERRYRVWNALCSGGSRSNRVSILHPVKFRKHRKTKPDSLLVTSSVVLWCRSVSKTSSIFCFILGGVGVGNRDTNFVYV